MSDEYHEQSKDDIGGGRFPPGLNEAARAVFIDNKEPIVLTVRLVDFCVYIKVVFEKIVTNGG